MDDNLHSDLGALVEEFDGHVKEMHAEGTFRRLFWEQQAQAAKLTNSRQMKWHPQMIRWCLHLKLSSGGAYRSLRESGVLQLPSERTLRDYTHHITPSSGFQKEVFEMLVAQANLKELKDWETFIALSFDEMKLKEGLVYDKHSDQLVGFVALQGVSNHLLDVERQCHSDTPQPPTLASHMLVVFIRGVFIHFNFPLAQFPSHGLTAYHLYPIITEAIMQLELYGFRVISLTSNGAASNRKLYQMMHHGWNELPYHVPYKMPNPYTTEARFIYFISDVPHLIKTTRNCWANSYAHSFKRRLWVSCFLSHDLTCDQDQMFLILQINGKDISWQHMIRVYEANRGKATESAGLWLLHKVKYEHIFLTPYSRMRVDLAAQVEICMLNC